MEIEIAQKQNQKSDALKQISGLVLLTVAIIFIFNVIDLLFGLDENFAKEEKLGLWRGTFIKPEKWRKLNYFLYNLKSDSFKKNYIFWNFFDNNSMFINSKKYSK